MHSSGAGKCLWLPLSALLLCFPSPYELRRRRSSHLAIKKGGVDVSLKQSIETSDKGSAERPQEPPRDRQGARRRADHTPRSVQVGIIHNGRTAALEAWLEPVRAQRLCARPDGLPARPTVRRQ